MTSHPASVQGANAAQTAVGGGLARPSMRACSRKPRTQRRRDADLRLLRGNSRCSRWFRLGLDERRSRGTPAAQHPCDQVPPRRHLLAARRQQPNRGRRRLFAPLQRRRLPRRMAPEWTCASSDGFSGASELLVHTRLHPRCRARGPERRQGRASRADLPRLPAVVGRHAVGGHPERLPDLPPLRHTVKPDAGRARGPIEPKAPIVDPTRFATLALYYANRMTTDSVRQLARRGDSVTGKLIATARRDDQSGTLLPLHRRHRDLAVRAGRDEVRGQERRRVERVHPRDNSGESRPCQRPRHRRPRSSIPRGANVYRARPKTMPLVVFLAVMFATIGLAFVLENTRPRIREEDPERKLGYSADERSAYGVAP